MEEDLKAIRWYESMTLIRGVEERIVAEYPKNEIRCPTHLSVGQEASAVGVCHELEPTDVIFSTHRCHAHYLAKGGDLKRMIAEIYGKASGCAKGKGGSMHLVDPSVGMMGSSAVVGGSIPLAVGAALHFAMRGEPHVAVTFFGDGASEEGVFSESLHFAALRKLPVILVCENNLYATLSRIDRRQCTPIAERAQVYGALGLRVDGNNVRAVSDAASIAVQRAREGNGPTLLEVMTYRWFAHVGPEEDTGKMGRTAAELAEWKSKCPISRLGKELPKLGMSPDKMVELFSRVDKRIDEAFALARAAEPPCNTDLLHDLGDEV